MALTIAERRGTGDGMLRSRVHRGALALLAATVLAGGCSDGEQELEISVLLLHNMWNDEVGQGCMGDGMDVEVRDGAGAIVALASTGEGVVEDVSSRGYEGGFEAACRLTVKPSLAEVDFYEVSFPGGRYAPHRTSREELETQDWTVELVYEG